MQLKLSTLGRYYRSYPRNVDANWTGLFVIVLLVTIIIIIRVIYASSVSRMSKIIAFVPDSKNRSHRRRWVSCIINKYIYILLFYFIFFLSTANDIFFIWNTTKMNVSWCHPVRNYNLRFGREKKYYSIIFRSIKRHVRYVLGAVWWYIVFGKNTPTTLITFLLYILVRIIPL